MQPSRQSKAMSRIPLIQQKTTGVFPEDAEMWLTHVDGATVGCAILATKLPTFLGNARKPLPDYPCQVRGPFPAMKNWFAFLLIALQLGAVPLQVQAVGAPGAADKSHDDASQSAASSSAPAKKAVKGKAETKNGSSNNASSNNTASNNATLKTEPARKPPLAATKRWTPLSPI